MLIPFADISGPVVDFCVNVIDAMGLGGVFLLMAAGSACIPIPSEAVMLFAGFNVSSGDQTLLGIVLAGLAGNMVGSWLTYAVGSLPWVLGFGLIGRAVGDNWEQWRHHLQVLDYLVVAAIVGLIVYAIVRRRRSGGSDDAGDPIVEPARTGGGV
jgi:membrane protein DedA with SNARE-associated domain